MCHYVAKRMDEMSKSAKPWFSPPRKPHNGTPSAQRNGAKGFSLTGPDEATYEARRKIKQALARGGRPLLLPAFAKELKHLLHDQADILPLLDSNPDWALPLLNRQYHAIRSAAEVLELDHLVAVASRAEVLANLLDTRILPMTSAHGHLLTQTHGLLVELVTHIAKRGSDVACYPIAKTAHWMYTLLDPALADYEPGQPKARNDLH